MKSELCNMVCVCVCSGGPPGAHQYPPQGWGNTYQQWQPPAPHDPSEPHFTSLLLLDLL